MAALMLLLVGCDTENDPSGRFVPARPVSEIMTDTVTGTWQGAVEAVQTPFEDVGLKRQLIPEKLQQIVANPYALPIPITCVTLYNEIVELDALLGPDVCTPENPTGVAKSRKGEYVEEGSQMAREHAVGIVSGQASIIPLRGLVRKASGADKHAKAVTRAYEAGMLRRAFLKGMEVFYGCNGKT